jgi:cation transport regulator ChaC
MLTELKVLMDIFRNFVQEVTSMPDMTSGIAGQQQHNRTMGGMSMLFGAADSYTRGVVFNIDNDLTKPMVRALYDWEMQYNQDASIKGDMQVDAGGVQGLMSKELTSQRMAELIAATGQIPGGADYINMGELMKEVFRSMDVMSDTVVYTEEEVKKSRAEKQAQELQQQTQMAGQVAQAQNIPKAKAETTKNDMLMQVLEKTVPTDPIYPLIYAKWLEGINELDPMSEAALNMMKTRSITDNKAFANQQEIQVMQADIEMADKLRQAHEGMNPPSDPSQPPSAPGPSTTDAPPPDQPAPNAPAPVQNVHVNIPPPQMGA